MVKIHILQKVLKKRLVSEKITLFFSYLGGGEVRTHYRIIHIFFKLTLHLNNKSSLLRQKPKPDLKQCIDERSINPKSFNPSCIRAKTRLQTYTYGLGLKLLKYGYMCCLSQ